MTRALNRLSRCLAAAVALAFGAAAPTGAQTAPASPPALSASAQQSLRSIYKELIEINTTDSVGDCTKAAQAMAARLLASGFPTGDVSVIIPPDGPKKGNLIARLHGS